MIEELKPCPFCGGTDITVGDAGQAVWNWPIVEYAVRCRNCGAEKTVKRNLGIIMEQAAAEAWNRRAEDIPVTSAPMFEYPKSLCPPFRAT